MNADHHTFCKRMEQTILFGELFRRCAPGSPRISKPKTFGFGHLPHTSYGLFQPLIVSISLVGFVLLQAAYSCTPCPSSYPLACQGKGGTVLRNVSRHSDAGHISLWESFRYEAPKRTDALLQVSGLRPYSQCHILLRFYVFSTTNSQKSFALFSKNTFRLDAHPSCSLNTNDPDERSAYFHTVEEQAFRAVFHQTSTPMIACGQQPFSIQDGEYMSRIRSGLSIQSKASNRQSCPLFSRTALLPNRKYEASIYCSYSCRYVNTI